MPRRSLPLGPETLALIEDARVDLLRAALAVRDGENDPGFDLPDTVPSLDDEDAVDAFREKLIVALSEYDADELRPLEIRSRRIRALASGKGVTSLDTIVSQKLDHERAEEFENQPDELCRSIWAFLNAPETFDDAESFHFARQFRDHRKLYDAFEVDLESAAPLDAAGIDHVALAARIKTVLKLKPAISCTVRALDLPPTDAHPASIMLIVRHGGPLSSVYNHRDNGRRVAIYYRPPNEVTLIYTPSLRQIEVCADSPVVRQQVSDSFAEVALNHDISRKPLTWKRYNLMRFRSSLALERPEIEGYDIIRARVLETEVRLGQWRRKLMLKVTIDDDIEEVADQYLGAGNVFRRAERFSRIAIAVVYSRAGDATKRTLNIMIAGTKSCNLQGHKDPEERSLGFALLKKWGILTAFRQIAPSDLRAMFAELVKLHDWAEDEVTGQTLLELGLDPIKLIEGGLLERRDRQDVILIDDGNIEGEATIEPSGKKGMVRAVGPFGEDAGDMPAADLDKYALNADWLHETILQLLQPLLSRRGVQKAFDPDLTLLGAMEIGGTEVPVYFARRLNDPKTAQRLDLVLRARNTSGVGIVLAASGSMPSHLGSNVVMSLLSHLAAEDEEMLFARDGIELDYRAGLSLARGGGLPRVDRSGKQSGTLYIPGREPLYLAGNDQLTIFERLVAAHSSGTADVYVGELMDGFVAKSPQQAFRKEMWKDIVDVYIAKGAKRGYWRLVLSPRVAADRLDTPVESAV